MPQREFPTSTMKFKDPTLQLRPGEPNSTNFETFSGSGMAPLRTKRDYALSRGVRRGSPRGPAGVRASQTPCAQVLAPAGTRAGLPTHRAS